MSRSRPAMPFGSTVADRTRAETRLARNRGLSLLGFAVVGLPATPPRYDATIRNSFRSRRSRKRTRPTGWPDTPFLQHAKQAGLKTCSTVFPALGQLLTNGAKYGVQSSGTTKLADNHVVQALVGMNYATQDYSGPAAGLVFAAPTHPLAKARWSGWRHSRPIAPTFRPCFRKAASSPTILGNRRLRTRPMKGATRCFCPPATAASSFPWPRQQQNKEAYNEG